MKWECQNEFCVNLVSTFLKDLVKDFSTEDILLVNSHTFLFLMEIAVSCLVLC